MGRKFKFSDMKQYKVILVEGFFKTSKTNLGIIHSDHDILVGDYIILKRLDLEVKAREFENGDMTLFVNKI